MANHGPLTRWTPERDAELRRLCQLKLSYSKIAAELGDGLSRNAIIGRVSRLGITNDRPPRNWGASNARKSRTRKPRPRITALQRLEKLAGELPAQLAASSLPPEPAPVLECRMIGLMELDWNTCRWPIGDVQQPGFGFCGVPSIGGQSYCRHHHGLAYQVSRWQRSHEGKAIRA